MSREEGGCEEACCLCLGRVWLYRAHRFPPGTFLDLDFPSWASRAAMPLRPGCWLQRASYQAQRGLMRGKQGGTMEGALFPNCHSHDSLTSGPFPFLWSFSPSLHLALLQFPFSIFLSSIHTKALRELSGASCLLLRLVSSSWTSVLGLSALEVHGVFSGAW